MIGICEKCGREYKNIYAHKQSKKYLNDTCGKDKKVPETIEKNIKMVSNDDIEISQDPIKEETEITGPEQTIGGIQIIGENTGKKEKSTLDGILDKLFSEEYLPITTSIIGALTSKLAPTNEDSHKGQIQTETGEWVEMI